MLPLIDGKHPSLSWIFKDSNPPTGYFRDMWWGKRKNIGFAYRELDSGFGSLCNLK